MRYPWHATYHFGLFFCNNYDGNKYISFQDLHDPRGVIFQNFRLIFIGPMKGNVGYWYNHGMWYINLVCFFSTKTMGIMKILSHVDNMTPWYWITPWLLCQDKFDNFRSFKICLLSSIYHGWMAWFDYELLKIYLDCKLWNLEFLVKNIHSRGN